MTILQQFKFIVQSQLPALDLVLANLEYCHEPWIDERDWSCCQLVLAEGFTNAVRHAHRDLSAEHLIEIHITLFSDGMEIKIWDEGEPFDLLRYSQDLLRSPNPFELGGRGIFLMRTIATHLSYERGADQRNCLFIVRQFSTECECQNR
jgi:serine/threonine-protein kinase RsbW